MRQGERERVRDIDTQTYTDRERERKYVQNRYSEREGLR